MEINVFGLEVSIFAVIFGVMFLNVFASICELKEKTIAIKMLCILSLSLLPVILRALYCFVLGDDITMQPWVWIAGILVIVFTGSGVSLNSRLYDIFKD